MCLTIPHAESPVHGSISPPTRNHNRVLGMYGENTTGGTRVGTLPMKKDQRALNQLWCIGPQGYICSALTGYLLDAHPNGRIKILFQHFIAVQLPIMTLYSKRI